MKDYSQFGEQAAILAALGYTQDVGEFVNPAELVESRLLWDIGAWHPTEFSNSRALIELGWQAILFEPSPGPMQNLLAEYGYSKHVTLVQAAVALQAGLMDLWASDDAVSTSSDTEHERWKDAAKFRGKLLVPAITLEHIANRFGGAAFVNIDVEGGSAELFLHMLTLGMYPTVVCCEHDGRTTELLNAATAVGYHATLVNSTNIVVVRK